MITDRFDSLEIIGRELFASWLKSVKAKNIDFTEDKYCPVDCIFFYKGISYGVEIKVRDEKYRAYDTHMLQESKLKDMLKFQRDNKIDRLLYVNFFGDWMYVYVLGNETYNIQTINLVKTTAESNGYTDKNIIWLDSNTAFKYFQNKLVL